MARKSSIKRDKKISPFNKNVKSVKKNKNRSSLKSVLQSIYNDTINLDTEMSCECTCCKVACPSMNYCEFLQIISVIWKNWTLHDKGELIAKSLEYYVKNDFSKFGIETLVKPCLLQGSNGLCRCYEDRQLACRLFGQWPEDVYNKRVEKFAKAYSKYGLEKEDLPLNTQCNLVKRKDDSVLTEEIINSLYDKLNKVDKGLKEFTDFQIEQKQNYRSFHDWLLLKIFGEEWLSKITVFVLAATKEQIEDQIQQLKIVIRNNMDTSFDSVICGNINE